MISRKQISLTRQMSRTFLHSYSWKTVRGYFLTYCNLTKGKKAKSDYKLGRENVESLDLQRLSATLSPFDRFRKRRNRLAVTDLAGPGWCELQFQYELEKGGRKRRTQAMKIGHALHDVLEKEVHAVVEFELSTDIEEERLGLRLLNIFQGLTELHASGKTRELPVFGLLHGTYISGIIDQLQFEKAITTDRTAQAHKNEKKFMTNYFGITAVPPRDLVISDDKTRTVRSEPSSTQVNQAKLQLMIYHHLLQNMPSLTIEEIVVPDRFDPDRHFSDTFLAQAISIFDPEQKSDCKMLEVLEKNNLRSLWSIIRGTFQTSLDRLSTTLKITYLHQATGELISTKEFPHDAVWMKERSADILAWWHGTRQPRGVPIEEATKCSYCQFEEGCAWRLAKIQEGIERNRLSRQV